MRARAPDVGPPESGGPGDEEWGGNAKHATVKYDGFVTPIADPAPARIP
jgi:hypothetical protein